MAGSAGVDILILLVWGQIEELSIQLPLQEYIKPLHEAILLIGIVAGDVLQVGADEDQPAGAALAFGGGDPGCKVVTRA